MVANSGEEVVDVANSFGFKGMKVEKRAKPANGGPEEGGETNVLFLKQ